MSEIDPKTIVAIGGLVLVLLGVGVMIGSSSGIWTLDVVASKTAGILVGAFVSILGAIITLACLGVLEHAARVLSDLWNGLVGAFK